MTLYKYVYYYYYYYYYYYVWKMPPPGTSYTLWSSVNTLPSGTRLFALVWLAASVLRRCGLSLQEESGHVTEALLYMRRATSDKFRRYTIVAENSVGISRRDVELTLKGQLRHLSSSVCTINLPDAVTLGEAFDGSWASPVCLQVTWYVAVIVRLAAAYAISAEDGAA